MSHDRVEAVLAHVSDEETLALARELVRTPSLTGHEGRQISDRMLAWLREAGLECGQQEIEPERVNVWARVDGAAGTRLLLNGHLDTKPVDNMTVEPFSGALQLLRLEVGVEPDVEVRLALVRD